MPLGGHLGIQSGDPLSAGKSGYQDGLCLVVGRAEPGVVGVHLFELLKRLGEASLAIKAAYILVLAGVGISILINSLTRPALATGSYGPAGTRSLRKRLPLQFKFPRSGLEPSVLLPVSVALTAGLLTSLKMGGGFLLVPMMVYLLNMLAHMVVRTSLFQISFTSCGVSYMEAMVNHSVDLVLVLPLAVGSALGAQIGARVSRYAPGHRLMSLLGILVLIVMLEMVFRLIRPPASMLSVASLS
jgi:uncharacterized protein